MRMLAFIVALLAAAPSAALACRMVTPTATAVFPTRPEGVRDDLIILEVEFEESGRELRPGPQIANARVLRVIQGRYGGQEALIAAPATSCSAALRARARGYVVGRVRRLPGFLVVFDAYEIGDDRWRANPVQ